MPSANSAPASTDSISQATRLPDLDQRCWQQLAQSASPDKSSDAGFRNLTVATCTSSGADARVVVLRHVDVAHKYVWFHTDARSEKVLQLEAFPQATLLFWDDKQQVQLRLVVETRLHTDDYLADEQWDKLHDGSIRSYLSEYRPGTEQPGPYPGFPDHVREGELTPEDRAFGRQNFAAIECRVLCMEYLHLSKQGQTRARFQYEPVSKMSWLAP